MPRTCVIKDCPSRKQETSTYSLFKFPEDPIKRALWLQRCCVEESEAPSSPYVCSLHFMPGDFLATSSGSAKRLTKKAVPKPLKSFVVLPQGPPPLLALRDATNQASVVRPKPFPSAFLVTVPPKVDQKENGNSVNVIANQSEPPPLNPLRTATTKAVRNSAELTAVIPAPTLPSDDLPPAPSMDVEFPPEPILEVSALREKFAKESRALQKEIAHLKAELQTTKKSLASRRKITDEAERLRGENARLKALLESAHRNLKKKDKQLNTLRHTIRRIRSEVDKATRRNASKRVSERFRSKIMDMTSDAAILAMFRRMSGDERGEYDDPHLRAFALSLHYYSPRAYNMVRDRFKNSLPHEKTLSLWYSATDAEAGFTDESFSTLKIMAANAGRPIPVTLMLDDMSIRKKISIVGRANVVGFEDLGSDCKDVESMKKTVKTNAGNNKTGNGKQSKGKKRKGKNSKVCIEPAAKEKAPPALATNMCVLMVVCLNRRGKVPVGYFLHSGLNGEQLKEIVKRCIVKLYSSEVIVKAVVADGASQNRSMANLLGADIDPVVPTQKESVKNVERRDFKPFFLHPCDEKCKIWFMLDVCHMLKLVRNALASRHEVQDDNDKIVAWRYIIDLHKEQVKEGLRLTNKLTERHINWHENKMKVTFAAQTLSRSVALSLNFCELLGMPRFSDASATADFLLVFNNLFDVLNSFSKFGTSQKQAMSLENEHVWAPVLERAKEYIYKLKIRNPDGNKFVSVFDTKRSVPFQGFLIAIESIKGLFDDLVRHGDLDYLCTYKLSQDHLESFFGKVRQRHGSNNNPSAHHVKGSYKRLLLGAQIGVAKNGNILPLESIPILNSAATSKALRTKKAAKRQGKGTFNIPDFVAMGELFSFYAHPRLSSLSKFGLAIVSYIAGFVARGLRQKLSCTPCKEALRTTLGASDSGDLLNFIASRSINGGLTVPTTDVTLVCTLTEEHIRKSGQGAPLGINNIVKHRLENLENVTYEAVGAGTFSSFHSNHEASCCHSHKIKLIYDIAEMYNRTRTFHACKLFNELNVKKKIRHKLNKLILFNNQ